jgi:hypothetical protein
MQPLNDFRLRLALRRTLGEADEPQLLVDSDPRRGPAVIQPGMARGEEGPGFNRGHRPNTPHSVPSRVRANLTTHTHQLRIKRETDRRHHVSLALARCRVSTAQFTMMRSLHDGWVHAGRALDALVRYDHGNGDLIGVQAGLSE